MEEEAGNPRSAGASGFRDHFSGAAREYAVYRPRYPDALFRTLTSLAPSRRLAWDCATGNGQAALGLASFFDRVLATDASIAQLSRASKHPAVVYAQTHAERPCVRDAAVDLITVAQALHWFHLRDFFQAARRALVPRGVLAVWSYGVARVTPGIDRELDDFYHRIVGPYWPPERAMVESGYRGLEFPFDDVPIASPPMAAEWTLGDLAGYLRTWSATLRYQAERGEDPVTRLARSIEPLWGGPNARRRVVWPLSVRAGRVA